MAGFFSLEIPFWAKRKKRQEPEEPVRSSEGVSQVQAAESERAATVAGDVPQAEVKPDPAQEASASSSTPPPSSAGHTLLGQRFNIVESGLAPNEVESYVRSLQADYESRLRMKGESTAWDTFSKQVLAEAEREAARIKLRATQEADVEASRMIAEAKRAARLSPTAPPNGHRSLRKRM